MSQTREVFCVVVVGVGRVHVLVLLAALRLSEIGLWLAAAEPEQQRLAALGRTLLSAEWVRLRIARARPPGATNAQRAPPLLGACDAAWRTSAAQRARNIIL
jgi:hypothetical protein